MLENLVFANANVIPSDSKCNLYKKKLTYEKMLNILKDYKLLKIVCKVVSIRK